MQPLIWNKAEWKKAAFSYGKCYAVCFFLSAITLCFFLVRNCTGTSNLFWRLFYSPPEISDIAFTVALIVLGHAAALPISAVGLVFFKTIMLIGPVVRDGDKALWWELERADRLKVFE